MNWLYKNQEGFSAIEVVLVVIIIFLIGAVGYMVYKNHHKAVTVSVIKTAASKPATSTTIKTPATATNPYAGWTSYTTSVYNVAIKYPSTWKIDTSTSDSSDDNINLTAPDGFYMNIDYGNDGACGAEYNSILLNQPLVISGTSGYLDYFNGQAGTPANEVDGFFLSTKSTLGGGSQLDFGSNRLCINGATKSAETVNQVQSDPDYTDAILVAKSVSVQ